VSIAKAGMICTLPARTTVIAAANPAKGSWDASLTFIQNMKGVMTEALLSRFDVAFLMRDEMRSGDDAAVSRHIVKKRITGRDAEGGYAADTPGPGDDWANDAAAESASRVPLAQRCRAQNSEHNRLPAELLSTYVRYARHFAHPQLSKDARHLMREYYLSRRRADNPLAGQIPVTPRLLEALVRLSEARARAELRRVVLRRDVEDVIDILQGGAEIVQDVLPSVPVRKGKNKVNTAVDRLRASIEQKARVGVTQFREHELRRLAGEGVTDQDFDKALHKLNEGEGFLILASSGCYKYHRG